MSIKIKNVVLPSPKQWDAIIRGMRNPLNSWEKSDTDWFYVRDESDLSNGYLGYDDKEDNIYYLLGQNDLDLMLRLCRAGSDHRKFMRFITIYMDITAPFYFWKEFSTYKVGTVANSCSTMHKIHAKEFTLDDFSCEHLLCDDIQMIPDINPGRYDEMTSMQLLSITVHMLNKYREKFIETKDKKYWWQMIQILPSSYNQKRTVMLNYEVLANMYRSRKNHKLDEWRTFCEFIETLPYSELITGKSQEEKESED